MSSADPLFAQTAQDRIKAALYNPTRFAHRVMGEAMEDFRARAIACALVYDDEQLDGMGLGATFTRAQEADEATREFTVPEADEPSEPWRMPSLERHGDQYRHAPPWGDAPPVALAAAIVASVAFVLAVIALMT